MTRNTNNDDDLRSVVTRVEATRPILEKLTPEERDPLRVHAPAVAPAIFAALGHGGR